MDRDYKGAQLVTRFIVEKGSKEVHMITTMTNPSNETYDIYSGYSLCTAGGYMLAPFNLSSEKNDLGYALTEDEYGKFVLGYNEDWAIGLHFPNAGFHDGGTGWKDLYEHHTLAPGEEYTAEGWLQFEGSGNIAPIFESYVGHIGKADTLGTVAGTVTYDTEEEVNQPVVVVTKDGQPLTWAMGSDGQYSLMLPEGTYSLYAVAKNCAPSTTTDVEVAAGSAVEQSFNDVKNGGSVLLNVTDESGNSVYARIKVTGGTPPVVRFLGASTFFTGLNGDKGKADFVLAPGEYTLEVSSGSGFVSKTSNLEISVEPGSSLEEDVVIDTIEDPAAAGWYSADQHHHSNKLDGITPPEYLVRSQLAGRLDLTLVSDHDNVDNHQEIKTLSDNEGVTFIPAVEVSPNWAHFVMLNLPLGQCGIDPGGTPTKIFNQAREKGATIVVAHPYITYGYFYNKDKGVIPGEYDSSFDLIELQSTRVTKKGTSPDELTLKKAMEFWTDSVNGSSKKYYLSAGTDTHDVWSYVSGATRIYAHLNGELNPASFIDALKKGHAFVTMGPMIYPENAMYGETYRVKRGSIFNLKIRAAAVDGLKSIEIYSTDKDSNGNFKPVAVKNFDNSPVTSDVEFNLVPADDTWYCVIATDQDGDRAVSNPIWIDVYRSSGGSGGGGGSTVGQQPPQPSEQPSQPAAEQGQQQQQQEQQQQQQEQQQQPVVVPGSVGVMLNGKPVAFPDQQPKIVNGRTLVPVRFIAEGLGWKVSYNPPSAGAGASVVIEGQKRIVLYPGLDTATVDGKMTKMDVKPYIENGRLMVPVRFICEMLGVVVDWDPASRTVLIKIS